MAENPETPEENRDPAAVAMDRDDVEIELKSIGQTIDGISKKLGRQTAEAVLTIGRNLIKAKGLCKHGQWARWRTRRGISESTALRYMKKAREFSELPEKTKSVIMEDLPKLNFTAVMKSIEAPPEKKPRPKPAARPAATEATDPGDFDRLLYINDPAVFAQTLWEVIGVTRARAVYSLFGEMLQAEDASWDAAEPAAELKPLLPDPTKSADRMFVPAKRADRGAGQTVWVDITPYEQPKISYDDYPHNPSPVRSGPATRQNKPGITVVSEEKD